MISLPATIPKSWEWMGFVEVTEVPHLVATQSTVVRDPFSSGGSLNVIPANKFSHASSIILPLFPNPTSDNLLNNYPSLANGTPTHHADGWSVKIDHVINDK